MLATEPLPLAFMRKQGGVARALLVESLLLEELLNSAIEATLARISLEHHELAKRARDIGRAAVLLSLINLAALRGGLLG